MAMVKAFDVVEELSYYVRVEEIRADSFWTLHPEFHDAAHELYIHAIRDAASLAYRMRSAALADSWPEFHAAYSQLSDLVRYLDLAYAASVDVEERLLGKGKSILPRYHDLEVSWGDPEEVSPEYQRFGWLIEDDGMKSTVEVSDAQDED